MTNNDDPVSRTFHFPFYPSRTIQLQRDVSELAASDGVKSLEELKAERQKEAASWKWKEKNAAELNEYLRSTGGQEKQRRIERAEEGREMKPVRWTKTNAMLVVAQERLFVEGFDSRSSMYVESSFVYVMWSY